ncbi:MAG: cobalt-precorrin 5A hydrolase [Oscillibacter sp.]|nr:cobalt-precorrin 5A hydrolase [Oscillibacter sp.]
MQLTYLSFSDKGEALAARLAAALGGETARCGQPVSLDEWTSTAFRQARGLVFVGAAGIAVRAIAPYVRSKTSDPAVVVVDECGHFAVPILSGHLGGANDLARRIARVCGAIPVLTTATDANGVFAVDEWARRQICQVIHPEKIKEVSSNLLVGGTVRIYSPWPIAGDRPTNVVLTEDEAGCMVRLDIRAGDSGSLCLVPKILVLGVGCRKGTTQEALEEAFQALLEKSGVFAEAICAVSSIDLKREEAGLLAFCEAHGWPCRFYSAGELKAVSGDFTASDFVKGVTGVDNVCERSAVLASGGRLYWKKSAGNGVTMALAQMPYAPTWRWLEDGE